MIDRRFIALGAALGLIVLTAAPAVADSPRPPNVYETHVFVSDQAGVGDIQDPNLVNGWGIVHGPTTPWWVANNGTDTSTLYNGDRRAAATRRQGARAPRPGRSSTAGPASSSRRRSRPRRRASCSPARTARSPAGTRASRAAGSTQAFVVASHAKSIYKGLAIASWNGADYLYATDFHRGRVDVYDSSFKRKHWDGAFRDPHLPKHYAPFGIQAINGMIFVTYARQDPAREDEIAGPGKGFVDVFNARGRLLGRVASRGALDAPWGLAWAPATGFGRFSGDLLVGNFGNGRLNGYRWHDGHWRFDGTLRTADHKAIVVDGLWGIGFGNDAAAGPSTTLYFAAGPDDESHGAFGAIWAP